MQSLSGRAQVVVSVLDVAEVTQGEASSARFIAWCILGALRARYPSVTITLTPPVGEADAVVEAIAGWVIDFALEARLR